MKKLICALLALAMLFALSSCTFLLDTEETTVIPDETTDVPEPEPITEDSYQGYWKYENGIVLLINDLSWYLYDEDGNITASGPMEYESDGAYLMKEDGGSGGGKVFFDSEGTLFDISNYPLTKLDKDPFVSTEFNWMLEGEWLYSDHENIIEFSIDGNYKWTAEDTIGEGTYTFDGERIVFFEDGSPAAEATYDAENAHIFVDGDAGSYYYRSSEF